MHPRFFYVDHKRPFQSLAKYLDCAKMLCPCARDDAAAAGTVWLLATGIATRLIIICYT